jgi:NitT/TauT family transport system substrate-binding protein
MRWALGAILLAIVAAIGAFFITNGQNPQVRSIRVGYLPIAAELPLFVAEERGFLTAEGLNVELIRFGSSNELANAATADRVDILAGSATNVVFDVGTVSGKRHQLFLLNPYSNRPGHVTDHLIVRDARATPDIPSLKGRRVASFPGSVNRTFVKLVFEKHGLKWGAYEYIELPPPNWQPALASGAIDAVSALEPTAAQIIADGAGQSIFPGLYADLMPNVPLSGHWVAADFLTRSDPETVRKFVRAYERAVEYIRSNPAAAKQYLVEYANVRPDTLSRVNLNPWQTRAEMDVRQLQFFADLLSREGALRSPVRVTDYVLAGNGNP